ncbi:anaerobic ribonucleoside-triphosphate reductase activating protein [Alkaliphilus metalliredigens QYMF]|uniref:Anaerobic ribonucleoside-triphosphate reductase activating protein n=1 Tax=Alkaliphilus metalliredigens (strain QYMF) TaxID=293826 RepID=A6TN20_ALKMQ|nr:anaerobic ribonucleoside-triphosphate reductase activating protein [Alkaliphilus metalliredigens]ABR47588.1 anaerobic ribonucleoside-triphosphate reductase activating protein [Alkaliphilus metalliredigens QYMF]
MNIIGQEKSSFIDYPDKISTVYFTGGCNFRCGYCHNGEIVNNQGRTINEDEILGFLKKRKKFIDAVCISGGEPTLQNDLYEFVLQIKDLGFYVKLDTNGTNPTLLEKLIGENLIDYIAMDVKGPLEKYEMIVRTKVNLEDIKRSIELIQQSQVSYEFRTTVCQELFSREDFINIGKLLQGSKKYYLQNFRDGHTVLAGKNQFTPFDQEALLEIREQLQPYFDQVQVR